MSNIQSDNAQSDDIQLRQLSNIQQFIIFKALVFATTDSHQDRRKVMQIILDNLTPQEFMLCPEFHQDFTKYNCLSGIR